jgi:hypothetical protein
MEPNRPAMMMISLALVALGAGADDPGPDAWVARLGSPRASERDEALDALEAKGLAALPALRRAEATADPETRRRASAAIDRIGYLRLLRPTPVTLDGLRDRPLAEAVDALRSRSGFVVALDPEDDPRWRERRVRVDDPGPIGFWEALGRVATAGGLRVDPSPSPRTGPTDRTPRVRLVDAEGGPTAPTACAGPYRLTLTGLDRHRQVAQVRPPAEATVREEFTVAMTIVAEPGLLIAPNGPPRLIEAVDDAGRDLRPPPAPPTPATATGLGPWSQAAELSTLSYRVALALPEPRGRGIRRLKGYVPIVAATRTDEVFSTSLEDGQGRSSSGDGITLTVDKVQKEPSLALEISVRGPLGREGPAIARGPRQMTLESARPAYRLDDHIEVVDAEGRAYATMSLLMSSPARPDAPTTFQVNLMPTWPLGPPARLRYHGVAEAATEVSFDFADLPIP